MPCVCRDEGGRAAIAFFQDRLGVCMYDAVDVTSYVFGLLNILFWLCAQLPQIWRTFRTKKPESLSIAFLVIWLGGDLTNLLGCVMTHQTQVQLLTSVYFICVDVVMVSQYVWYLAVCRAYKRRPTHRLTRRHRGKEGRGEWR